MFTQKDYSKMTTEELLSEEKKMNSLKIPMALAVGFLVGIAVWLASHQGSFLITVALLGSAFFIGVRSSKTMKELQEEIKRRDTI